MDMLEQCINYWQNYVSIHRDRLRDHRYTIMVSTITCLVDYKKLKEQMFKKAAEPVKS